MPKNNVIQFDPSDYLSNPDETSWAEERRTHAPIKFAKLKAGQSGDYNTHQILNSLPNLRMAMESMDKGLIRVDPYSNDIAPTTVGNAVKHEAVHQLLLNQPTDTVNKIRQLTTDYPQYPQIAQSLMNANRGGQMVDETPAYMGAYNQKQSQTIPQWRDNYINYLKTQLAKMNPALARTFSQLSGE